MTEGAFPWLKVFWFTCKASGNELRFDQGAMLQSLYGDFEFGVEHLSNLT